MAMLASHIQIHDGLLVALSELLLVADREVSAAEARKLLQPARLGERVPDVIELAIDVAEWVGLLQRDGDVLEATQSLRCLEQAELHEQLPRLVRRGLLTASGAGAGDARGGDLARALAWFVAQDAWDPPRGFERVEPSAETLLTRQFPHGPEFINNTKWLPLCRWAVYLGVGAPDPVEPSRVVPDVTAAVRDELCATDRDAWTAREFVAFVGEQCPILDGGEVRLAVIDNLQPSELEWEYDDAVLAPSLSMAVLRLEREGVLATERHADAPQSERRSLTVPGAPVSIDRLRLTGVSDG